MLLKLLLFNSTLLLGVLCQHYEDRRCRCTCPSVAAVVNNTVDKNWRLFISNVPASKCNCDQMVLPAVSNELRSKELEYCIRCECKFESRNSTIIMVVVMALVWLIVALLGYWLCIKFICLFTRRGSDFDVKYKMFPDGRGSFDEEENLLRWDDDDNC